MLATSLSWPHLGTEIRAAVLVTTRDPRIGPICVVVAEIIPTDADK